MVTKPLSGQGAVREEVQRFDQNTCTKCCTIMNATDWAVGTEQQQNELALFAPRAVVYEGGVLKYSVAANAKSLPSASHSTASSPLLVLPRQE